MKVAAIIIGILGALAAGALGAKWISDARSVQDKIDLIQSMGGDVSEINGLKAGAYVLVGSLFAGIGACVMLLRNKPKHAAILMACAGALPCVFAMKALVFTWLLILAAVLSARVKPRQQPAY